MLGLRAPAAQARREEMPTSRVAPTTPLWDTILSFLKVLEPIDRQVRHIDIG
jgi:hypothetical protein